MRSADLRRGLAPSLILLAPLVGVAAAALFVLSWNDLLPGGWRLHGYFEPHHQTAHREQARRSLRRMRLFEVENAAVAPGTVAFLGSSTIERFPLAESYPGAPCVNRGIGNESALELATRMERSLPPVELGGVVVFSGRVDFLAGASPADVRDGLALVMRAVHEARPDTPGVLLGLLPERDMTAAQLARLQRTNDALEELAVDAGWAFVDTARPPLTEVSGALSEDCSDDRLHLNSQGYRHLSRWLVADGGVVGERLAP